MDQNQHRDVCQAAYDGARAGAAKEVFTLAASAAFAAAVYYGVGFALAILKARKAQ